MFNKAILIGRLTADPELKQTTSGIYLVNFQIAVDRRFKGQDGERKADFITIVCWRQQAEFVSKYFHKGDAIGIEGTMYVPSRPGTTRTARGISVPPWKWSLTMFSLSAANPAAAPVPLCRPFRRPLLPPPLWLTPAEPPAILRKWRPITISRSDHH